MPQSSIENPFTLLCGAPLRILIQSLSHSLVGKEIPSHSSLLVVDVPTLALAPDERPFGLVWAVAEQREPTERLLHIFEAAQVARSVLTYFEGVRRVDTTGRPVAWHAPLDDVEIRLFQLLCEHCKMQPGCVVLGYSSSAPMPSRRNAGQSGGVYQLDFLVKLHKVSVCSFLQKGVMVRDQSGIK